MSDYSLTHREFYAASYGEETIRSALKKAFGDTDPYTPLTARPWFTLGHYFYVSREHADHKLITWLLLHQ